MYRFELIPSANIYSIIPLLQVLNDTIDKTVLKSRLDEMIVQGYECVGVYDDNKLIGIAGLWFITKYYVGRHVEPDNVIILPKYRKEGLGDALMKWIVDYALSKGCVASALNCYVTNSGAQKFWMNQGYKVMAFHYQKQL
jgi:GNAT superfamily N-acetyltransferase